MKTDFKTNQKQQLLNSIEFNDLTKDVKNISKLKERLLSHLSTHKDEKIKIEIRKSIGIGLDKWTVSAILPNNRDIKVGYITYTIGRSGFATHFKYNENFNNLLRLAYYDCITEYKVYGVENPI